MVRVTFCSDLYLRAFEYSTFQVRIVDIHALHQTVCACKVPTLDSLPYGFDLRGRQRYEVRYRPHEGVGGGAGVSIFVVVGRLEAGQPLLL